MRSAVIVLLAACALGLGALLVTGATRESPLAFTLGVAPSGPSLVLAPGQVACQAPIDVPEGAGFDAVTAPVGTYRRSGPALTVTVRELPGGAPLARGTLPGGYADISAQQPVQRIRLSGTVPGASTVAVCIANRGARRAAVYGNADVAAPTSTLTKDGKPAGADLSLRFERRPQSVLSQFGRIADRAALFRPGWVGAWTYWLLAALVALGVPVLLALALRSATRD